MGCPICFQSCWIAGAWSLPVLLHATNTDDRIWPCPVKIIRKKFYYYIKFNTIALKFLKKDKNSTSRSSGKQIIISVKE
jgi:hypothetical protein